MTAQQPVGGVVAHIRSVLPSLLPTERAVATVLLERTADVVEMTSQQVAELAGASRATVVRTCQSLGYTGYQQLRVLLARDAGPATAPAADTSVASTPGAMVASTFAQVGASVGAMVALLDHADVARAVTALATAGRVLVVGTGLSSALAADTAARMVAVGRPAEAPTDAIGQQVAARQLGPADVLLVVSGSGATLAGVRAAEAAKQSGATVLAVTAFARSPLAALADVSLVVGMPDISFRDELTVTTRIPQVILLEGLVAALTAELGPAAMAASARTLEMISLNLAE